MNHSRAWLLRRVHPAMRVMSGCAHVVGLAYVHCWDRPGHCMACLEVIPKRGRCTVAVRIATSRRSTSQARVATDARRGGAYCPVNLDLAHNEGIASLEWHLAIRAVRHPLTPLAAALVAMELARDKPSARRRAPNVLTGREQRPRRVV